MKPTPPTSPASSLLLRGPPSAAVIRRRRHGHAGRDAGIESTGAVIVRAIVVAVAATVVAVALWGGAAFWVTLMSFKPGKLLMHDLVGASLPIGFGCALLAAALTTWTAARERRLSVVALALGLGAPLFMVGLTLLR